MRNYLIICGLLILSLSCNKSNNNTTTCPEPSLDCAAVNCLLRIAIFEFKIVDKTTGADLVFGPGPRYSSSDVKLYSDAGHTTSLDVTVDPSTKVFRTNKASSSMYLVIGGTKTYKLDADFKNVDCCTTRVKNLSQDGVRRCTCCGDVIAIPVD